MRHTSMRILDMAKKKESAEESGQQDGVLVKAAKAIGNKGLLAAEARVVRQALGYHGVVALGSGAVLDPQTRDLLAAVRASYYLRDGAGYVRKSYPPMEFDYHPLAWNKAVQSVAPEDVVNAPTGGAGTGYQFVDLYGIEADLLLPFQ